MDRYKGMIKLVLPAREKLDAELDEDAMRWVVRLTSGEVSSEDAAQFREWRGQDARHGEALGRARLLWLSLGRALPDIERQRAFRARRRRFALVGLQVAASLLVVAGTYSEYSSAWRYDYVTMRGEQRRLLLQDGSRVVVGANTAINLDFSSGRRIVELDRGELFLHVRHDVNSPFLVKVSGVTIRDIGTEFDVAKRGADVRVAVAQGEIRVLSSSSFVNVVRNQGVDVKSGIISAVQPADVFSETAWMRGRLVFRDARLSDICTALKAHYRGKLFVIGSAAGNIKLSASVEIENIDEWLNALERTNGVRVTRIGNWTFLT